MTRGRLFACLSALVPRESIWAFFARKHSNSFVFTARGLVLLSSYDDPCINKLMIIMIFMIARQVATNLHRTAWNCINQKRDEAGCSPNSSHICHVPYIISNLAAFVYFFQHKPSCYQLLPLLI